MLTQRQWAKASYAHKRIAHMDTHQGSKVSFSGEGKLDSAASLGFQLRLKVSFSG